MDERRLPIRRQAEPVGTLVMLALSGLGLVTLATVALAASSSHDDPLGTVTSSRLIPELMITAVVVTVLIGLTLWLIVPVSLASRSVDRPGAAHLGRMLGVVGWVAMIALLVVLARRLTDGSDQSEPAAADGIAAPVDEPAEQVPEPSSDLIPIAIGIGAAVVVLIVGARVVVTLVQWSKRTGDQPTTSDDEALVPPSSADAGAVREALAHVRAKMASDSDPRLAVIEAYWHLEHAMAGAGVPPVATETSSEFLDRCLTPLGPAADGARHLTQLFEWAMFSRHPITDTMRDGAREALGEVIAALDTAPMRPTAAT